VVVILRCQETFMLQKIDFYFPVMEVVCGEYGSYHAQLIQAAKDDTWKKSRHVPGTLAVLWLFS